MSGQRNTRIVPFNGEWITCAGFLKAPAHFQDVTDDKMKSNLVKILQEHSWITLESVYLSLITPIKVVEHILTTREISCGFGRVQTFYCSS